MTAQQNLTPLDLQVGRLSRSTAIMTMTMSLGGPISMLAPAVHTVVKSGIRTLELASSAASFRGTNNEPPGPLLLLAMSVFEKKPHDGDWSIADLEASRASQPVAMRPPRTAIDEAVDDLASRSAQMAVALGLGGPSADLPGLINPVLAAAVRASSLAGDRKGTYAGTGPVPYTPPPPRAIDAHEDDVEQEVARFNRQIERDERRARGIPWMPFCPSLSQRSGGAAPLQDSGTPPSTASRSPSRQP